MSGPHSLRRLRGDTRSVSPVIGAVLLLALAMMLLTILQTTAIPQLNAQVEFEHNQQVQADVVELEAAADRTVLLDQAQTTTVDVGVRYPPRPLFFNPPPVSGSLRTTDIETARIENARAVGETGDYWNGTPRTVETQTLVYSPDYNEYGAAPTTVYEPWAVYNRDGDRTRPLSATSLVDGRRISVVAIDGAYQASTADTVGVNLDPTSAPIRTVTVSDDGEPIRVTVPTQLRRDTWEDLLADERDRSGVADDRYVTDIGCQRAPPDPCGELTITLEPGTYEMRLGEVGIGSEASHEPATYLTDVDGTSASIPESGRQRLVVEVRDRYDNPVGGVSVTGVITTGPGTVRPVSSSTDESGRATFVYEAPTDVTQTTSADVELRFGDGGPQRTVTYDVQVVDRGVGSGAEQPLTVEWTAPSVGEDDAYTIDAGVDDTVPLTVGTSPTVDGLSFEYVVSDSSVGTVGTTAGTADAAGTHTTTFTAKADGTVDVYAIGGGDVDVMRITVVNASGTAPVDFPPSVDSLTVTDASKTTGTPKYAQFDVDYTVSDDSGLESARFTVVRQSDGTRIVDSTTALSGTSASGSETLREPDQNAQVRGQTYEVTITVTDTGGRRTSVTRTVTVE